MASKGRERVFPRRAAWDVKPWESWQRDMAADAWAREHAVDGEELPRALGTAAAMPREIMRPEWPHALSEREVAAAADAGVTLVTTLDGTYTVDDYDCLTAVPSFDYVTQGATTQHRDRRAFARPTVRTAVRHACADPCEHRGKRGHACIDEDRLYVRQLAPYGADGMERHATTVRRSAVVLGVHRPLYGAATVRERGTVRHVAIRVDRWSRGRVIADGVIRDRVIGRDLSPRQGRRARTVRVGYWPTVTYRVDPAAMVERDAVALVNLPLDETSTRGPVDWRTVGAVASDATLPTYRTVGRTWYTDDGALPLDEPRESPIYGAAASAAAGIAGPRDGTVTDRVWQLCDERRGRFVNVAWQYPSMVKARQRAAAPGRPRSGGTGSKGQARDAHADRMAAARAVMADPAAAAWRDSIGRAIEAAHESGREQVLGHGWHVTYDHNAPANERVSITRTPAHDAQNPRAAASFVGSWKGRRALAASVALASLTS